MSILLTLVDVEIENTDLDYVLANCRAYLYLLLTYDSNDAKTLIKVQGVLTKSKNRDRILMKNLVAWVDNMINYIDR